MVDVTPSYPIRLMGYGSRKTESEGVASPLKVRALAIGDDAGKGQDEGPAVLITVDNCAVGSLHDRRGGEAARGQGGASAANGW